MRTAHLGLAVVIGLLMAASVLLYGCARDSDAEKSRDRASTSARETSSSAGVAGFPGEVNAGEIGDGETDDGAASDGDADETSSEGREDATVADAAAASTPSGSGSSVPAASATNTDAIQRELEAIQRELDALQMPSDSDFAGIEDALF